MEELLAEISEQIRQSEAIAEALPSTKEHESISESVQNAGTAASEAKTNNATRDRDLAEVDRELSNAIEKLKDAQDKASQNKSGSGSAPVSGPDVEKRKIDLTDGSDGESSQSKSTQVVIDEFEDYLIAGDGQKKKQIAIQEVLDQLLESAQEGRNQIAGILSVRGESKSEESNRALLERFEFSATPIVEILTEGIERAEELREVSAGTPYAFFGLQSKAIVETGFIPAAEAIEEGIPLKNADDLEKKLRFADERLRWIISLLNKSNSQFQEMIKMEEIVELTHQFRKMHQITLEDLPVLSGEGCKSCKPGPYPQLKAELSDQDVQQVIAGLKLKREVLKRLAELLQDNPELRTRLLSQSEESGKIYREELSILRNRQRDLAEAGQSLLERKEGDPLPESFAASIQRRLLQLGNETTGAVGNARIWIPSGAPEDERKRFEEAISPFSDAIDQLTKVDLNDETEFGKAVSEVRSTGQDYEDVLTELEWKNTYTENRLTDLEVITTELEPTEKLVQAWRARDGNRFLAQQQQELNGATNQIILGLMNSLGTISGVDTEVDRTIEQLDSLLTNELLLAQKMALSSLEDDKTEKAVRAKLLSVAAFENGVGMLDAAIVKFVEAQSKIESPPPPPGGQPLPDPSESEIAAALEELLRKLEEEARDTPETKLGIKAKSNLQIQTDWEKEQSEKEKKQERQEQAQRQQQQMKQAQQAARTAAKAQQMANSKAQGIANHFGKAPVVPWKDRRLLEFEGRNDWNTLPSELKQSLTQDFESTVPEEYREAIQRYFRIISEVNQGE